MEVVITLGLFSVIFAVAASLLKEATHVTRALNYKSQQTQAAHLALDRITSETLEAQKVTILASTSS